MSKLLLFGPDSVHVANYLDLIQDYFDHVLLITDGANNTISYAAEQHQTINFSIKNPLKNLQKIKQLRKIIEEYQPDIIHVHNIGTGAYLLEKAVRGMKIPKIATAWGSDVLVSPKRSFIFRRLVKNVLQHFDVFTCDAHFMASEMQNMINKPLNIVVANFGVDSAIHHSKENIIYSNRLHQPLYRIETIIQLFVDFATKHSHENWKLVVAATGSETEKLIQQVNQAGVSELVQFVGWINKEENLYWYQRAKIYISIPKSDGTSISLLEAMENECIPIVSNLPANNEWITDGYNGIIYHGGNQQPIEMALNMDYASCTKINKEIIKINGLKPSNRAKFISIYNQLLS